MKQLENRPTTRPSQNSPSPKHRPGPHLAPSPGDPFFSRLEYLQHARACPDISDGEFRLLSYLVDRSDGSGQGASEGGNCFPSIRQMAKGVGKEPEWCGKLLRRLEVKGWVFRIPFIRDTGGRTSDLIQFTIPPPHPAGPQTGPLSWGMRQGSNPAPVGHPLWSKVRK